MSRTYVFARNAPSAEYDRSLAWAALLLAATGLVMVYSASIATAESSRFTGNNAAWYLARHGVFLAAALSAAIAVFLLPIKFWQTAAPWLFAGGVSLLIVVLIPGPGVVFTVSTGLLRGRKASVVAAFGCTAGIVPHLLATVLGLAALMHTSAAFCIAI